jgi:hypothetical protein
LGVVWPSPFSLSPSERLSHCPLLRSLWSASDRHSPLRTSTCSPIFPHSPTFPLPVRRAIAERFILGLKGCKTRLVSDMHRLNTLSRRWVTHLQRLLCCGHVRSHLVYMTTIRRTRSRVLTAHFSLRPKIIQCFSLRPHHRCVDERRASSPLSHYCFYLLPL